MLCLVFQDALETCSRWRAQRGCVRGRSSRQTSAGPYGSAYISVAAVTATIGSALTAGHFGKAGMPAQPKVTKGLLPPHPAPR